MTKANITWITDQIATGGDLSFNHFKANRQWRELIEMDIDLIIDCRIEANDEHLWDGTGIDYLHLPTDDVVGGHIPYEHFDKAVEAARPVLERGGKVFAHCHMGINRGPSTAFAILLDQKMPATKAFDLIRKKRPQAAVYFAKDAMAAHLNRRGVKFGTKEWKRRYFGLMNHIEEVFPPSERRKVGHIIRTLHKRDRMEMLS